MSDAVGGRLGASERALGVPESWESYWLVMLRLIAGWWFLHAGLSKLLTWPFDAGWFVGVDAHLAGTRFVQHRPIVRFLIGPGVATSDLGAVDRIAMSVGGGLVVAGVVGVGLLELAMGASSPVTGDGQAVSGAVVPLDVRVGMIVLGLVVWGLCAVAKPVGRLAATRPQPNRPNEQA